MDKNVLKLDENTLSKIIRESVNKVIKEWDDQNDEYWKGGPDVSDLVNNLSMYSKKAEEDSYNKWWLEKIYQASKEFVDFYEQNN